MISGHGGNIHEWAGVLKCRPEEILDMSSNVNPLGPIPGVEDFLCSHIHQIANLPEADAATLISRFAHFYDIDPSRVLAGNGSTQLIYNLPLALDFKNVKILGPTYSDYADACAMHQVPFAVISSDPENGFVPDDATFDVLATGSDAVFICNPNNPTGVLIPGNRIKDFSRRHPDILVVVDESYLPFVENGDTESLVQTDLPNVVVLNSMSKIFRIPGLRIGFVVSGNISVINSIRRYMLPWSVNSLAQAGVLHILSHRDAALRFIQQSRIFLKDERNAFHQRLSGISDLTLFHGQASFILGKLSGKYRAPDILNKLIQHRILIRDCANFIGLSDQYIRVSLKMAHENERFADVLKEVMRDRE